MLLRPDAFNVASARQTACAWFKASGVALVSLLLAGCAGDIWNAGDLAEWVREQAVKEHGCVASSIELEEWYESEDTGNVWHGTCRVATTGENARFGINVDSVWKPSELRQ